MAVNIGDFQLGPFQVFPTQSLVRKAAQAPEPEREVHVEPKVMAVLERLAQEPLQVVSRSALLSDVWTGTVVTDEVVTRCISELRNALGDSSRSPSFIQTIPKKGYKLLQVPQPLVKETQPLVKVTQPLAKETQPLAPDANRQAETGLTPPATDTVASDTADTPLTVDTSATPPQPAITTAGASTPKRPRLYWALVASIVVAVGLATALLIQGYIAEPQPAQANIAGLGEPGGGTPVTGDNAAVATEPAIAILPFATLDNGEEANYFGAGLAEELLNALVNVPGLRVISRHAAADASAVNLLNGTPVSLNDSLDISAIASSLGVDAVLTGSVRRMDNNVRVTAQLINGQDGVHMWADQFEGDLSDVFRIQDEIAAAIVGALRLQLTEPVRVARISTDMNALDYYLLGRHQWHQRTADSLTRAIDLFERAVEVDPQMAIAYSGLADAYLLLADYGDMPVDDAKTLASPAIDKALALEADLAEAHASRGMLYLSQGEPEKAERSLRNAIRLNPGYNMAHMWLGSAVAMQGRVKEAHKFYLKAYRLDPLHPVINQNVAMSFATIGDYNASQQILDKFDPRFDNRHRLGYLKLHLAQQIGDFSALQNLAAADMASDDAQRRMAAYHALWLMHSRRGEEDAADQYLRMAQAEPEMDYKFLLDVARKLAREGAATQFATLMRSAPEAFHDKVEGEKRALEGMLLIATENYSKAATAFEAAITKAGKKHHPASELLAISHLLHVYQQLDNTERRDYWLQRGSEVVYNAIDAGYGQFEFITEVAFFHAAAGQSDEAAKAFWHALTLGKIAPWEITDDIRVSRIQTSDKLVPVVKQAARGWTA